MQKWPVLLMVRSLEHGGCERDATKIAVNIDRTRFEPHVSVFTPGGFRLPELQAANVPVVHLPLTSYKNLSALKAARKLGRYIRDHGIRLVQCFDVPTDMFGAPVARWYGVPAVITSQLSFRSMYGLGSRCMLRVTDRLSHRVLVNSKAVGDSLQADYGIAAEKIALSYNGVDTSQFFPGPGVKIDWQRDGSPSAGSICVMRSEKRIDWVMRSFSEVQKDRPGARLLLLGSGPEVPRLLELRDRLGIAQVTHFEEGRSDVAPWMRSLDIYINCSSIESFPNGLLEAMASGCCVIGSRVGGIPELITHMHDGLTFDVNDPDDLTAMLRLAVSDAALREKLRANAAATARERFPIAAAVHRMEALYQELLEPPA